VAGRVLIVEDEPGIAESLAYLLEREAMVVTTAADLAHARAALAAAVPDVVILDLGLPDGNGLDLLRELRARGSVPVLILTSRDAEMDRVVGLELGADDYITKPFSAREVLARVRAVLRRVQATAAEPATRLSHAGVTVDLERRRARVGETEVELTKTELDLLAVLCARPGQVFSREALLDRVWGDGVVVTDRTVDVHVKGLRQKLRAAGATEEIIETVRGVGYRMRE
jgi:two-component system catabolic regulation response regulator CreB